MVTHIVSDMGGVLVRIEWQERVSALLERPIAMEELHRLWVSARSTLEFETGQLSFDDFAEAFVQEFDLSLPTDAFKHEFLQIVQGPMAELETVLAALKPHFHLSLLSNTNSAHYEKLQRQYAFFDHFDELFLSYQIGYMKPDAQIFQYVLQKLQVEPSNVAFFDDGSANVEGARRIGIQAFQVDSPMALWQVVQELSERSTSVLRISEAT